MTKQEKSQLRKQQRHIKRIYEMIKDKSAVFLTMSFNDEILKKTNETTRKRYIKDYLKRETAQYIANIDYGAKKGREHYHAIIKATTLTKNDLKGYYKRYESMKNKINLKAYKYGNIQADFIGKKYGFKTDKEIKQTAINLYNHSIKETTKNNKIILSRKEPSKKEQYKRLLRLLNDSKEIEQDLEEYINGLNEIENDNNYLIN